MVCPAEELVLDFLIIQIAPLKVRMSIQATSAQTKKENIAPSRMTVADGTVVRLIKANRNSSAKHASKLVMKKSVLRYDNSFTQTLTFNFRLPPSFETCDRF